MTQNKADDHGGAIYMNKMNMYLEDCSVTSNASGSRGGGIYLSGSTSIGVGGTTVIRSNDGDGTMDNLVLGSSSALIYNYGLDNGSEIHLRNESDGDVKLSGNTMSDYQLKQYFRPDHGTLELTETKTVDTDLKASVFSEGRVAIIIAAVLGAAAIVGGIIYHRRKRKGGTQ